MLLRNTMMVVLIPALALHLWVRRDAWKSRWDTHLVAANTCMVAGILTANAHTGRMISEALYPITRHMGFAAGLGACCHLTGMACLVAYALSRLATPLRVAQLIQHRLIPVAATSSAAMMIMLVASPDTGQVEMSNIPGEGWMIGFRIIYATAITVMAVAGVRCMLIARRHVRSRGTATGYLAALALSWLPMPLLIAETVLHPADPVIRSMLMQIGWITGLSGSVAFLATAAWSYSRRWAGPIPIMHATPLPPLTSGGGGARG